MSEIHIVRDYPYPPAKVWRAVTDPALVPLWTVTGLRPARRIRPRRRYEVPVPRQAQARLERHR